MYSSPVSKIPTYTCTSGAQSSDSLHISPMRRPCPWKHPVTGLAVTRAYSISWYDRHIFRSRKEKLKHLRHNPGSHRCGIGNPNALGQRSHVARQASRQVTFSSPFHCDVEVTTMARPHHDESYVMLKLQPVTDGSAPWPGQPWCLRSPTIVHDINTSLQGPSPAVSSVESKDYLNGPSKSALA